MAFYKAKLLYINILLLQFSESKMELANLILSKITCDG